MNKETINTLYQTFYAEMFAYIMAKVKDKDIAEDVTEDVFIELFMMRDILENPEHFPKLGKRIADRECEKYVKLECPAVKSDQSKKLWGKRIRKISMFVSVIIAIMTVCTKLITIESGKTSWLQEVRHKNRIERAGLTGIEEDDFDAWALSSMHLPLSYGMWDILDIGVEEEYYRSYMGIDSVGYIVDGVTSVQHPEVAMYASWIEVSDEKYVDQIIREIKSNLKPEEWEGTKIQGVSAEDFMYCSDGEYIFVCYFPDEEVNDIYIFDMEKLEKKFHKFVELKREIY